MGWMYTYNHTLTVIYTPLYSDRLRPLACPSDCPSVIFFYVTPYLKSCYSYQLKIKIACVSYGSPHLRRLLNFSILTLTFLCDMISLKPLLRSTFNQKSICILCVSSPEGYLSGCVNFLIFCEFFKFQLQLFTTTGQQLNICASNGDSGGALYTVLSGLLDSDYFLSVLG